MQPISNFFVISQATTPEVCPPADQIAASLSITYQIYSLYQLSTGQSTQNYPYSSFGQYSYYYYYPQNQLIYF